MWSGNHNRCQRRCPSRCTSKSEKRRRMTSSIIPHPKRLPTLYSPSYWYYFMIYYLIYLLFILLTPTPLSVIDLYGSLCEPCTWGRRLSVVPSAPSGAILACFLLSLSLWSLNLFLNGCNGSQGAAEWIGELHVRRGTRIPKCIQFFFTLDI